MQIKSVLSKCASGVLVAIGAMTVAGQPSQAQTGTGYYCGSSDGLPTTIYQSPDDEIPLIRWKTTLGEVWTPQARCEEVARRFDRFDREATLEFLTTGEINKMPVVCAVAREGEECSDSSNSDRVLFTLPAGRNPNEALEQLLGFATVVENGDPRTYRNGRTYVNVKLLMRRNLRLYNR